MITKELLERKKQLNEKITFYRAKKRYDDYLLANATEQHTEKEELALLKKKANSSKIELDKAINDLTDLLKLL